MAKRITQAEFEQRIQDHFPEEHFEIIEYTTISNPLKIKCLKCNKILQYPRAKNFIVKNKVAGCSDCNGLRAKNKRNLNILQERYEIIEQKRNSLGKLLYTCKCKMCGRISTHQLNVFLESTCRCEGHGNHWTEEEFKKYLFTEYNNEYIPLGEFKTVNDKMLFKHSCGFIWSVTPAHILYNKTRCPKCYAKQSKGSQVIESQLQKLNVQYEKEKFLNNSLQRFDFYFIYNDKEYAIEYNGKQHYEYVPFLHGNDIKTFEKYKERDLRKAQYCILNNIELIIIPYTFTNEEIKKYINSLFDGSTTSLLNVAASAAK